MQDIIMAVIAMIITVGMFAPLFFLQQSRDEIIAQQQKEDTLRKYGGMLV